MDRPTEDELREWLWELHDYNRTYRPEHLNESVIVSRMTKILIALLEERNERLQSEKEKKK